ncbi:MAG TPA: YraN family protein [Bacteroidales bacterium]|nr:YraN family protein [Bacteroidales bacterium]HSA42307.1 YraN family protein [Bacteroidales bacterium]
MAAHIDLGKQGEQIALEYLKKEGYQVLHTNWRSGINELDIVARKGDFLVVVEVKTRTGKPLVEPEVAVDFPKQKALIKAANSYILKHNISLETRFDIISIVMHDERHQLHHITDAFYPRMGRI